MIIWRVIKSVVGSSFVLALLCLILCVLFGLVLAWGWQWLTWIAQVVLSAVCGFIAMGTVLMAKEEIFGKAESPGAGRKLGMGMKALLLIVFIAFAAIEFYAFSWMRTDWNKDSYVIYVHNGCKYDIEKVETYVDYKYQDGDKTFTIHPKKDSAYVINLSEDTLTLYEVSFRPTRSEFKRHLIGKNEHIVYVTRGNKKLLKVIAPHKKAICGKMDNLDLFEDVQARKGSTRRVLSLKED